MQFHLGKWQELLKTAVLCENLHEMDPGKEVRRARLRASIKH